MVFHGRLSHHGRQLAEALARTTSSPSLPTPHQTFNLDTDLVDLRGKVAIVTGGKCVFELLSLCDHHGLSVTFHDMYILMTGRIASSTLSVVEMDSPLFGIFYVLE